jgi:hypothetical protein
LSWASSAILEKDIAMNATADLPFSRQQAFEYAHLVNVAYTMSGGNGLQLKPDFPGFPGYNNCVGWVQMQDFSVLGTEILKFYGVIVQKDDDPNKFVLAVRGTEGFREWYDDVAAVKLVADGDYQIGNGFKRIFQTMQVMLKDGTLTGKFGARDFAEQVAATVKKHAPEASIQAISVDVCGHSLGAALATLYVARNSKSNLLRTPLLCTFASPRVGDPKFAGFIDALPMASWRVVNRADQVPHVPFDWLGFQHIRGEQDFWDKDVSTDLPCNHFLNTYLHLLHPDFLLDSECDLNQKPGPHWETS